MHAHPRSLFSTSNFMCCRPRFGSSRSLCMYFLVLKLGEIKSILGIGPALIEIIGIFSENFSNFIWWGVSRGMGVMIVVLKFLVSSIRNGEIASACIFWQNDQRIRYGRLLFGMASLALWKTSYASSRISLTLLDNSFMLKGFWIKPLHPLSSISVALPSLLYPLERSTLTLGSICFILS